MLRRDAAARRRAMVCFSASDRNDASAGPSGRNFSTANAIARAIDPQDGGLNGPPKFPQCALFDLLWRAGERAPVALLARQA